VTFTRAQAFAVLLAASVLTMTTVPLFAAASHEVCDAMRHGCAKIDALPSCCCGDPSESNPSRVPSNRTLAGADATHTVAVVTATFQLQAVVASFVHEGLPPLAQSRDLSILFGDLRI